MDRPLKGALLMQTLARVNRTFRGKEDGLLVAYAPLAENLQQALAEFTRDTRTAGTKTLAQNTEEAADIIETMVGMLADTVGVDWKATYQSDPKNGWRKALLEVTSRLRSPGTPGNTDPEDPTVRPVADTFRSQASRLHRAWALAGRVAAVERFRLDVKFYEEVRTWLAKLDAQDRIARGEPIPEEIARLLGEMVVDSTEATGVMDIYAAAGLERPRLDALTPAWMEEAATPSKAELAIEGLRTDLLKEATRVTGGNEIRRAQFSERINAVMAKYTNQQLTAAEVIAELVEMAKEVVAEADRGRRFTPPLHDDELMFYDVVAQNEAALDVMGDDVLAQIARDLVATMRRDIKTDWTVREDVKAKLRASIKRLLRKYGYPPDQQPEAIVAVMRQMEAVAPRIVDGLR